jgi:hypothetical protein
VNNRLKELYLSRLKKCDIWTEQSRSHGMVNLFGATKSGQTRSEACAEEVLLDMLREGTLKCSAQQRLTVANGDYAHTSTKEVTVKYWSVIRS